MKLLVDMNLSPDFCPAIARDGLVAIHWSAVGRVNAPDIEVMRYARDHDYVVISHDLDFSAILAATHAQGPSVVQVRTQDVLSPAFVKMLQAAIKQFSVELETGAILVIDADRAKVKVLPIR
jgi:predicted nuclease of predicted toxin-antitoxin system